MCKCICVYTLIYKEIWPNQLSLVRYSGRNDRTGQNTTKRVKNACNSFDLQFMCDKSKFVMQQTFFRKYFQQFQLPSSSLEIINEISAISLSKKRRQMLINRLSIYQLLSKKTLTVIGGILRFTRKEGRTLVEFTYKSLLPTGWRC